MELRAVEQAAKDLGHLRAHDARAVVLDRDLEARLGDLADLDAHVGQDAGLLAGVERVVDALLHGGEQRLRGVVEAQQVAVLGEELGDGDVALALGQVGGGGPRARARRRPSPRPWPRPSAAARPLRGPGWSPSGVRLKGERLLIRHAASPRSGTMTPGPRARKRSARGRGAAGRDQACAGRSAPVFRTRVAEVADQANASGADHVERGGDHLVLVVRDLGEHTDQLEERAGMRLGRGESVEAERRRSFESLPPCRPGEA